MTKNSNDEIQTGAVMPGAPKNSADVLMKAEASATEALGVIGLYLNIETVADAPTWDKISGAKQGMPAVIVDVLAHVLNVSDNKSHGARFDSNWAKQQKYFQNMMFDEMVSGEGATGTVVLDLDPLTLGRPHMGSFQGAAESDRLPTIRFTGIPETSPMFDDDDAACWALWSVPTVSEWLDSDGRPVFQPSKRSPNVYGIIRTFATRQDCIDAELDLRQAVAQFCQSSPDFIQQQDAMRNAEREIDHVDVITGEITRQKRRVAAMQGEAPF
jgi:hypothetical protein